MSSSGMEMESLLTLVCVVLAAGCLAFVLYLAWRQFGPSRRHRRHRRRLRRYVGKK